MKINNFMHNKGLNLTLMGKYIFRVGLGLVLSVAFSLCWWVMTASENVTDSHSQMRAEIVVKKVNELVEVSNFKKSIQDVSLDRNPFKFSQDASSDTSSLQLQGFMESRVGYTAVINNTFVEKGTKIGGWEILEISKNQVTLIKDGVKRVLKVRR
ncbi:MAG: hypothetical protein HRT90_03340 [Candidatus Margulisbacteria bacterium]|nr:hypothetical protein [Candidatus Margulisiibacteriota bacterium]